MKKITSFTLLFLVSIFILSSISLYFIELPRKEDLNVINGNLSNFENCSNPIKGMSRQNFTIQNSDESYSFHIYCKKRNTPIIHANDLNKPITVFYQNKYGYLFIPQTHVYHLVSNEKTLVNYSNFVSNNNGVKLVDMLVTLAAMLYLIYLARKHLTSSSSGTDNP